MRAGWARVASTAAAPVKPAPVATAQDVVSARLAARAQGSRVEVVALRDETSTTWVNPDGTLTTQAHGGPIRFRDPADPRGAWRDVDLTMAPGADGTVGPKGHPLGLSLAGASKGAGGAAKSAGRTNLAVAKAGKGKRGQARGVTFGWDGALGTPALSGASATYREVKPGVDLVVDARRTGYETHLVVKSRAALNTLRKAGTGAVSWEIPVDTTGLTARAEQDGSVSFVDADGQVASFVPAPIAWDAKVDPHSGNRASESPVAMTVTQQGPGRAVLTLTPDRDWLASSDRVFPVTIDPTYATGKMTTISDAYVSSAWPTSNYRSSTELRVGTHNGGGDKQRSFLQFDFSGYKNLDVVSASLSLYETWSYSCTAKPFYVHASGATDGSVTWNTQPGVGSQHGSLTTAKGFSSSCAAGWVSVPITSLVSYWSGNAYPTGWLRLSASETDSYGWKKFSSLQGAQAPYITFTYNRKPNLAVTPDLGGVTDGANSFTIPGSGVVQLFTKSSKPRFYSSATDPDGSQVAVNFEVHTTTSSPSSATLAASCSTPLGASGARVSCTPTSALAENTTYYVRAAVKDERGLWNGSWSGWRTFYTLWSAPPAPQVACDRGYTAGAWTDADPAGTVTCSITAAGVTGTYKAPGYLDITLDGVAQPRLAITPTNDASVVHKTITFTPAQRGYHEIRVTGISRSLTASPQSVYGFGWGSASLASPAAGTASSGTVRVAAGGPPKGTATTVTAKVRWRVAGAGNETTGWTDAASGPVTVTPSGTAAAAYTGVFDLATAVREAGASGDLPTRTPVRLDVQVCFTYTGTSSSTQCTWSQSPVTVTRLPHAFGAGYPTADTGLGQLALFTGEVALEATDVAVPGYSGQITLSRSHVSFAGDQSVTGWPGNPVTGVFGPGWSANLEGGPAGLAGLQVIDNTGIDGSIAFLDEQGDPLVYANPAGTRSYPTGGTVTYEPATLDTAAAAVKLTVTGTGTGTRLSLSEDDGTTTTWAPLAAPTPAGTTWRPDTISEPGQAGKTTFGRDGTGRVTRIVAPVPDGMTGTSCPAAGTLARGCRAIEIAYATTSTATSATPGDVTGQVKTVSAWLWNPATSAMAQSTVATYAYDTSGRLVQMRDPRTGLGTDYTWDGASTRIASVRSSGLAATKLAYSSGKLTQVTREAPAAGQPDVTTARYVYGVPTSGAGLPTLTAAAVGTWGQQQSPTAGYAVFGQDYTGPVSGAGVDWSYADLSYVDDLGYTVNTASYGAGAWQVTATDYDTATSTITRTLSATATATAAAADPAMSAAQVDALSTQTFYNTEQKDGQSVVLPAGARVTDTYAPARRVVLADGSEVIARPHTHTDYDQGAPNGGINPATGQRYSLPTTVTVTAAAGIGADLETISSTSTGYGKLHPGDTGEGDGWALGLATTTTAGGITRATGYDTLGRVTQTRQPRSDGTDAGTTKTAYYTAGAQTGADAACGNRPEWAGLTCRTYPAAAPSSGPTLPATMTSGYSMWLAPTTTLETSGAATRTTTTSYDTAGRTVSSTTTTSGLTGSTGRPGSYTRYRTDTGLVDYTGWLNGAGTDADTTGRTTTSYDRWGRAISVLGDAGTVTTSYDTAGRIAQVIDAKGSTSYGYDGPGERRGLPTTRSVTRAGTGGSLTWAAAYDREGRIARQTLPGRVTQVTDYDEAGQPIGLSYLGQVTPVTVGTDPDTGAPTYTPGTPVQDQPWMTWSTINDITGRTRLQATGTGAAFDDGTGVASIEDVTDWTAAAVGAATSYAREYRYDGAGRLTYARTAETTPDPATQALVSNCTERAYTFDANGNRTNQATTTHPDGDCTNTGTTTTTATSGWDTADRPTTGRGGTGTYIYDLFGRQTTIPAVDAPDPTRGDIALGYYDDDLPRSITEGDTATTFTLDATGRRATQTSTTPAGTTTTVRRYTGQGDNPSWIETTAPGAGSPLITRFAESLGGDLSATIGPDGATSLSLADPHGDTVTTVAIPADQPSPTPAVAITGWASYDEYGNPPTPSGRQAIDQVDGPLGYGWLGAKQRSTTTDTAGLTLMGVRLYNPNRGLFTAVDPIPGGNTTAYTYPQDPINMPDLNGKWSWGKFLRRAATVTGLVAAGACIIATAGVCGAAVAVSIAASGAWNGYQAATGRIGWSSALKNTAIDYGSRYIRPVRSALRLAKPAYAGRHTSSYVGRHRVGVPSYRQHMRFRPVRTSILTGINVIYAYRSWGDAW